MRSTNKAWKGLIPRPRWPEEPNPPYDFEAVDKERFTEMGAMLTQLTQRREGEASMRDKLLELYFKDGA